MWSAKEQMHKLNAFCALQYYLSKIEQAPKGKDFAYYVLVTSPDKGIYGEYHSLCKAKEGLPQASYKGFYSQQKAED